MEEKECDRRPIRVKGFDYSQAGAYFVTICAWKRSCIFGKAAEGGVVLLKTGEIVAEEWLNTAIVRPYVTLDVFTVMPNHFHGILWLRMGETGTARRAPTMERFGKPVRGSLPTIIGAFKAAVTRGIKPLRNIRGGEVWQRGYYEHVIRDENSLGRIREYIVNNAENWDLDLENFNRKGESEFYSWLESFKTRPSPQGKS